MKLLLLLPLLLGFSVPAIAHIKFNFGDAIIPSPVHENTAHPIDGYVQDGESEEGKEGIAPIFSNSKE